MKLAALLLLALATLARAEIVTIYGTNPPAATSSAFTNLYTITNVSGQLCYQVEVRAHEVCRILSREFSSSVWTFPTNTGPYRELTFGAGETIVGPGHIRPDTDGAAIGTFEITRVEDFASAANTITIPPDTSGPVLVTLETSTNLTTWQPTTPGSFGVSTAARHFRLRALRQSP